MSINFAQPIRRSLLTLIVVVVLTFAAVYMPILLGEMTGSTFTAQVYACQPSSGSCG